jgi:hypothetical protein
MTNEELCELGMPAYILFTGLWMLADREGRLEYRPKRIKVEAMPLWEDVSFKTVENLVEKLCESGFIHRYEIDGKPYLQIVNWRKHQHPHPREVASVIPEMNGASARSSTTSEQAKPRRVQGKTKARSSPSGSSGSSGSSCSPPSSANRAARGNAPEAPQESPPPTPSAEHKTPTPPAARKPPASETDRGSASDERKPEDMGILRESLTELGKQIGMPPPDDAMVRQILDAGHGADGRAIHELLVALHRRQKFRDMRSWGLVPLLVAQHTHAA